MLHGEIVSYTKEIPKIAAACLAMSLRAYFPEKIAGESRGGRIGGIRPHSKGVEANPWDDWGGDQEEDIQSTPEDDNFGAIIHDLSKEETEEIRMRALRACKHILGEII